MRRALLAGAASRRRRLSRAVPAVAADGVVVRATVAPQAVGSRRAVRVLGRGARAAAGMTVFADAARSSPRRRRDGRAPDGGRLVRIEQRLLCLDRACAPGSRSRRRPPAARARRERKRPDTRGLGRRHPRPARARSCRQGVARAVPADSTVRAAGAPWRTTFAALVVARDDRADRRGRDPRPAGSSSRGKAVSAASAGRAGSRTHCVCCASPPAVRCPIGGGQPTTSRAPSRATAAMRPRRRVGSRGRLPNRSRRRSSRSPTGSRERATRERDRARRLPVVRRGRAGAAVGRDSRSLRRSSRSRWRSSPRSHATRPARTRWSRSVRTASSSSTSRPASRGRPTRGSRRRLQRLRRDGGDAGLVLFSDTAYQALPPGTPVAELGPFERFFRVAPPTTPGLQPQPPRSPWTSSFSAGTRISTGLSLALDVLQRDHVAQAARDSRQ